MRPTALLPLLLLAPALAAHAAPATSGLSFTHNDWTLACDNTRTCRAAGYQNDDDGDNPPVSILLTRRAGPDQPVSAELMLGQYDEVTLPKQLSLQINDAKLGALKYAAAEGTAELSPAQVTALLASLTRSSRIVLVGNDGKRWTVSDRGASAVLLKMDEYQGRLGTPGALVRKGKNPESTVLPALPVPVVKLVKAVATRPADEALATSAALRAALAAATSADDCEALHPGDSMIANEGPQEITVQRLSASKLLVSQACWRAAYNTGDGYWVVNDRAPYQPTLVTTSAVADDTVTIEEGHKGRGLGDCWYTASWAWNGTAFVRTAVSSSGLCRLVSAGGPWDLPTLVTKVQK
jgi:invasion protein IalB